MKKRHKHADVIIAWANGAKIEYRCRPCDEWDSSNNTSTTVVWHESVEYRIKPEVIYPKTKITSEELKLMFLNSVYVSSVDVFREMTNAAIRRAIIDGDVAIVNK